MDVKSAGDFGMDVRVPYKNLGMFPDGLQKEMLLEIGRILNFRNIQEHERYVSEVEEALAGYFQTKYAIAVDSGTSALQLALTSVGVGEGDEVIVPSYTYVATALAVTNLGAKPVFVDIKLGDLTIDPDDIESHITSRTKAVIPVHIHGLCCDMSRIRKICAKHSLAIIEDASQAHGASIAGKKVGRFGIGCFSLHTSKSLGGVGDAGLIVLDDSKIHSKIRRLLVPDSGTAEALESRRSPCVMDAIQAAIIKRKLAVLDMVNERKREIAGGYDALISDPDILKPSPLKGTAPVYRDYFIISNKRDIIKTALFKQGIETKTGYNPLHLMETFKKFSAGRRLPVSESVASKVLLLPSYWGLTDIQLKRVGLALHRSKNARS